MADSFNIAPISLDDTVSLKRVINQIISKVSTLESSVNNIQQTLKDNTSKLADLEARIAKLDSN